jgi:DNA-binding MarR family transcriptional regulator
MQEQRAIPLIALLTDARNRFADDLGPRLEQAGYRDIREAHGCVFGHIPPEGARLTQLAEAAKLTKQAVGEVASDLEQLGYLERVPDPTDGRAKILMLTAKGREAQETGRRIIGEIEAEWAERYGERELAMLRATLEEIVGATAAAGLPHVPAADPHAPAAA